MSWVIAAPNPASTDNRPASSTFHAITVVWGREYLDLFLNTSIPSQLGEGNVAALPPGSRYRILTRGMHVDEVRAHPMVEALGRVIPVDIVAMNVLEALDHPEWARRSDSGWLMTVHSAAKSMFADACEFSTNPRGVYWRVGVDGLLATCFEFHPLMVDPMDGRFMPKATVDADYVAHACPDMTRPRCDRLR